MSHFGFMLLYAAQISLFFAVLWRRRRRSQIRLFVQILVSLMVGGLLVAWLLFAVPGGPPTGDPKPLIETVG